LSAAGVASAGLHWDSFKETMDQLTQHHMWMDGDGILRAALHGRANTIEERAQRPHQQDRLMRRGRSFPFKTSTIIPKLQRHEVSEFVRPFHVYFLRPNL